MNLKESVAKTLSFFSCFNHPLTTNELHQWLWRKSINYEDFLDKQQEFKKHFGYKDSYFFLLGNKKTVEIRQKRVKFVKKKLEIAKKAANKLRWIPFIKTIFVCNTLALGSVDKDSDIDFFIVTKTNRVWLVRFFANIILKLFGLRVNKNNEANKICLSFFTSESRLDLSEVSIGKPDVYLIYWLKQLLPLYDPDNFYQRIQEKNKWTQDYLPNIKKDSDINDKFKVQDSKITNLWRKIMETIWSGNYGNLIDKQTRKLQEKKLKGFFGNDYNSDGKNIILQKNIIKLHKNDRRKEYQRKWKQNYKKYLDD